MRISAIVATRMTSSRLPGKVLMDLCGEPALIRLIGRLRQSKYIDEIVIATTMNSQDDIVVETAKQAGVRYYRGDENDVLARTVEAAESVDSEFIVQVTSDCPLIDAETIDAVIERMIHNPFLDYVGNHLVNTYPLGFSAEIFRTSRLREVERITSDPSDREHVSLYFYEHPEIYKLSNVEAPEFLRHPNYRLTLDTAQDYELIHLIYKRLYVENPNFNLYDIVNFLEEHPELLSINRDIEQKKAR